MPKNISKKLPVKLKKLTPIQIKFYNDQHRFPVVTAGRRSRKTLISQRKVFNHAMEHSDNRYFLGAPTHQQAKNIYWNRLMKDTQLFRTDISKSELTIRLINGSELVVLGLDRPERIEGQEWHGGMITEFGMIKSGAWHENIRPALADTNGFCILDGVPEGRNHYYDRALYACDEAIPDTIPFQGAFHDCEGDDEWAFFSWFSSDVLDSIEIDHARQEMDERTFRQEYEGSFESYAGIAYYTFGVHNFDDVQRDFGLPISVGMDFNVNPMTAVLGNIKGNTFEQWDEIWLENSNTLDMRDELLLYVEDPSQIIIYPDSTGGSEHSNATKSDLAILRQAGFEIRAHKTNPYIKDRVNAVNSFCVDRKQKTRYKVDPKECPKTINDMNRVIRTDDGRLDKKQEKDMIGHITAGLGYLITFNWPVKKTDMDYTKRY